MYHTCMHIYALMQLREWGAEQTKEIFLWNSILVMNMERHLNLLYRGQSTLSTYLKNVWCSTLHFQRCLQAVLLRASKKNEVSLHCERWGENTGYWLWCSPEGSPPQGSRNPEEQRLTPKEKLFLEGCIKNYFPLSTIMKPNFYLNLSAVTFINSFYVISWLWIIQAMERESCKSVHYKWTLYTENTACGIHS